MFNPSEIDPLVPPSVDIEDRCQSWLLLAWEVMAYQVNYYRCLGDPFMYELLPRRWHWGQQNAELSDVAAPWN